MIIESFEPDINETSNTKDNANGASYGFVAGYKQFFNEYLGLRYYANVDLTHATFKSTDPESDTAYNFNTILVNYGVNVDFLGNFVVTEIADFGGFIGLGIGGNTWTSKDIKDLKDGFANDPEAPAKVKDSSFDIALNVGLRTNIAKYHGVELVARVPFIPVKILDIMGADDATGNYKYKFTFGQKYSIVARYTFSF